MKKILFIVILSVIIFLLRGNIISFAGRIIKNADNITDRISFKPNAVIDYPEVNLREKPNRKAKNIGSLRQHHKIYVVNQDANGWFKIKYTPGKFGYIFGAYVRFINSQDSKLQGQVGIISRSSEVYDPNSLNRLFKIKKGERVVISGIINDKAEIISPSGKKGILPSKCVDVIG